MACLVFDTCCGIKLRTGSLIIGCLLLVSDIIAAVFTAIQLLDIARYLNYLMKEDQAYEDQRELTLMIILTGVLLLFIILSLAVTISLLVGVYKKKRGLIKLYIICGVIFILIRIILQIVGILMGALPITYIYIIITISKKLLNISYLFVLRSYYIKLGGDKEPAAVYSTA